MVSGLAADSLTYSRASLLSSVVKGLSVSERASFSEGLKSTARKLAQSWHQLFTLLQAEDGPLRGG